MRERWKSLFWAIALVSVAIGGMFVFNKTGPDWLARVFMMPIWWPLIVPLLICGGFHGCGEDLWFWPTTFVVAVLMWWFFIEGVRYWWRRRRGRAV